MKVSDGQRLPLIAITGEDAIEPLSASQVFVLSQRYVSAVTRAGGLPLMPADIRLVQEYADITDALILTEGPPVHRARYGKYYGSFEEMAGLSITRDEFEFSLFQEFRTRNKPVLGIGRGIDIINVALGGVLRNTVQEFPGPRPILVRGDTKPGRRFPALPDVYSGKRPQTEHLGSGLIPWALGTDEVPEGVELPAAAIFGIQWHTEWETLILNEFIPWFIGGLRQGV